jgi:hypothetical protein
MMGGCDQADVHLVGVAATQSFEFLLLQDAQQFGLKFQRNVADLVKKERAFVRRIWFLRPSCFPPITAKRYATSKTRVTASKA